jgi:hypothetical protein
MSLYNERERKDVFFAKPKCMTDKAKMQLVVVRLMGTWDWTT